MTVKLTEQQDRALTCVLEQMVVLPVGVRWAKKKIVAILNEELVMKDGEKLISEGALIPDFPTINETIKKMLKQDEVCADKGLFKRIIEYIGWNNARKI